MAWSLTPVRRWWKQQRASGRREAARRSRRRLRLEPLESRRLLAQDCLGAIAGTVFTDLTGDGLTGDDDLLSGIVVNLYQDGGDGVFSGGGGDDTLIGSQMTDGSGQYRFDDLFAGDYFVEQEPATGLLMQPGDNVQLVVVSAADAQGTSGLLIDSFQTAQSVTASSAGSLTDASAATANEAVGGERDLFTQLTSGMGELSLAANAFGTDILDFMASSTGQGIRLITWDGPDMDATTLDATGLRLGGPSGVDLTESGDSIGLELTLGADQDNGLVTVRVFTDAANASEVSIAIPNTGGAATERVVIFYSDFVTSLGAGADFANVGAIQLEIEGVAAVDGQIDLLGAVQPGVVTASFANLNPIALGDTVWLDLDNSGTLDGGESGIAGVTVNLFEDTDGNGQFSAGVDQQLDTTTTDGAGIYQFEDLLPGDYIVQLPESNFGAGQPLEDLVSSSGNNPAPDPDNDVDDDDNGTPLAGQGIVTAAVTLTAGGEPLASGNPTVDFGLVPQADLSIVKSDSPDPVGVGELLTYTLDVTNAGPVTATGVTVVDTLPAGVTFDSATVSQGSFSETNGVVTFDVGQIASGGTAQLTLVVSVNPGTVGPITNTADVTADQVDPDPSNNSASESTVLSPRIDLEITKSDNPDPVASGNQLTYTVVVTNNGPSQATGVTVTDMLPNGVTFDSAATSQGTFSTSVDVVTFDLGTLAVGASAQMTVVVEVDPNLRGTVSNTAQVTANETENDPTNNSVTEQTTLDPEVDLVITKTGAPTSVVAGEQLVYTLEVTNEGPSQATGVTVTDTLPAGVTFVQVTASQGTASQTGGVITAELGTLDPDASATVTITVNVNPDAASPLANTAQVEANEDELDNSNNTDDLDTVVTREVDMTITKTGSPDTAVAGQQLVYTVEVTNQGPSQATGVTVIDTLPPGVVFSQVTSTQGTGSHANGVVTVDVGTLAPDASATITITVDVEPSATGPLVNTAVVETIEAERVVADNTDELQTPIEQQVDLAITKTGPNEAVAFEEQVEYTLQVTNNGPSDAEDVVVVDTLPDGVTFVSATDSLGGTPTHASGVVTANLGDLADGQSATVTIVVLVDGVADGMLTNSATVSSSSTDVDDTNNEAQVTTEVDTPPSSISGQVYIDLDDDGVVDQGERPVRNVMIMLTGTDVTGQTVNQTQMTGEDGSYSFDNLLPGTYRVEEIQPNLLRDGRETIGTPALGTVADDAFENIQLGPGVDAEGFNFGERPVVTKLLFLASTVLPF